MYGKFGLVPILMYTCTCITYFTGVFFKVVSLLQFCSTPMIRNLFFFTKKGLLIILIYVRDNKKLSGYTGEQMLKNLGDTDNNEAY